MQLRDYQVEAINNVKKSFLNDAKSVLLTLPTGAGKTVIFSQITKLAKSKGSNVLILVHRKELIDQAGDKLTKANVKYGIIAAGHKPIDSNVQVASVQTLINRLNNLWIPSIIIIDEAHHAVASSWQKVFNHYKDTLKLGVTATPMRMTGAGLGEVFDDLIVGSTIPELVELGHLAKHEVYAPPNKLNLDKIRTIRGDFNKKEVEDELDKVDIVGDAVDNYRKLGQNKPAIAFCISVKHGQYVTNKFKQAGYTAELITGSMKSDDRKTLVDNFKTGKVQILVSIDVVSEGFDVENCSVAILLRPTQSEGLYIQQVGRVLRPEPNKTAIVLDHVGNTKRHGFVDDVRDFDLHQKAKSKRKGEIAPAVQTCEQCFAVFKPQPICPVCGHEKVITKREITYEDGELVKMRKQLMLDQGDPLIEKSTGVKFYFYAWDDDQKRVGFQFSLNRKNPKAKCFTEAQFKDFCKKDLYGIHSKHTDYAKKKFIERFLSLITLAEVDIDDIAVIRTEQIHRKKQEEWSCKTQKDWIKLADKRGHNHFWAKKRWELRKKRWKPAKKFKVVKLNSQINKDKSFDF
nr:helicase [uncultured Mediterranean phage uvMED]